MHIRPLVRIVAGKGDIEVVQPEMPGQSLALVGHRCGRVVKTPFDWKPVRESVKTVQIVPYFEFLVCVHRPYQ